MREMRNLHQRVQQMADCYAATDHLQEMAKKPLPDEDVEEAAVKWLALAILHGVNANAEKISIYHDEEGRVRVKAEYRPSELPAPSGPIAEAVIQAARQITHIEGDKGKLPVSIGIRDSSVDLEVKIKSKDQVEKLKLIFK